MSRTINGVSATWAYDILGRLSSHVNSTGTFGYTYFGATGRLQSVSYPNGQTTAYVYLPNTADKRLAEIHNQKPGASTLSRFTYAYDAVGNVKTWTQQADASAARAYDFTYNPANELVGAVYRTTDPTPAVLKRYSYAYDPAGNRTAEQIDDVVTGATYDNMNRLTSQQPGGALLFKGSVSEAATVTVQGKPASVTGDNQFQGPAQVPSGTSTVQVQATDPSGNVRTNTYQVSQSGTSKTFSYDANGNLTGDGTRTYEWDAVDRLVAVNQGTQRSEFNYDGTGRRVRIVEKDNSVVVADRRFVWCGTEICEERDATGGTVVKSLFRESTDTASGALYLTRDHLNSTREMTDGSVVTRARYDYDPYGRQTKVSGDSDSDFGFTGHLTHPSSGLVMATYRVYEPSIGRWISGDPAAAVVRDASPDRPAASFQAWPAVLAAYSYADDNPSTLVDVLGMASSSPQQDCSDTTICNDAYGPCQAYNGGTNLFANARCVCICMGNDPWSNYVRCCLVRYKHLGPDAAHLLCYGLGRRKGGPIPGTKLADCIVNCVKQQQYQCPPGPGCPAL